MLHNILINKTGVPAPALILFINMIFPSFFMSNPWCSIYPEYKASGSVEVHLCELRFHIALEFEI